MMTIDRDHATQLALALVAELPVHLLHAITRQYQLTDVGRTAAWGLVEQELDYAVVSLDDLAAGDVSQLSYSQSGEYEAVRDKLMLAGGNICALFKKSAEAICELEVCTETLAALTALVATRDLVFASIDQLVQDRSKSDG